MNKRGLKIHQGRIRILTVAAMTQRTEVTSGQTQEELGLEVPRRRQKERTTSRPHTVIPAENSH